MRKRRNLIVIFVTFALMSAVGFGGPREAAAGASVSFLSVLNHIKVGWLKLASVEANEALTSSVPMDKEFLTLCGFLLSASGQPVLARDAYLRVIKSGGLTQAERGSFLALIGRTYLDQQDYRRAQDYHLQALAAAGDEAFSLVDLGSIALRQGELSSAKLYLDRAEAVGGTDSPRLFMVRGDVALADSKYEAALGFYQTALSLAPSDQQIYYRLKQVYQQSGRDDQLNALIKQAKIYGIELN